ncbi:MAG: VWA domain-containing protein [Candidatus Aenigmarchaeota archaeon]|nr:VWA domain-containing protein [Candidatus Aenigmarchaeota archaeon]
MEISFTLEHSDLLIALVSIVIALYFLSRKLSKRRAIKFGNFETLRKVAGKNFLSYSIIPLFLRILAILLIILALSAPKMIVSLPSSDTDYIITIDTSSSMLTPDIKPNRLEATRFAVLEFVKENGMGSFGVVTFSGETHIQTGLTKDSEKLNEVILSLQADDSAGTSIGEALIVSSVLLANSTNNKTILLITDGRNNRGLEVNKTYDTLLEKQIRVVSIGIGKDINETAEVPEELKDLNATAAKFPSIDEHELREVANISGGSYFRVSQTSELKEAIDKAVHQENQVISVQFYLLFLACIILLIGWGLEITKYRVIP